MSHGVVFDQIGVPMINIEYLKTNTKEFNILHDCFDTFEVLRVLF